ncbi:MAG TPA: FecR family protein [Prolixibacteraceae bacterium]|nr:FecR family protein [Prolixibacteraceae bacterium]
MNQEKIWSHISRRISQEGTEEDVQEVEKWLGEKPVNRKIYVRLQHLWNCIPDVQDSHSSLFESIKRRIAVYESKPKSVVRKLDPFLKVAAVLAVVLLSNFFVYQYFSKSEPQPVTWHEIVVPRGNRMKIILPDKSSVWLNNETRLKYATDFSVGNRVVELSGEAYFDIHHDVDHPFIVKIGDQRIKVLGTKFSVNAYPEDHLVETSLISGSVEFDSHREVNGQSKFMLEPGYSLFYDKKSNKLTREKIQSSYYQYWENGVYAFKEESFESLAIKIKRIFNVEIIFKDEMLKNKKYTGTIGINDNIYLFMEAIRRTSVEPIEYQYNKNIINVKLRE